MQKWQLMFVNFALFSFILQLILIVGVYFISKFLPADKTDKELLEGIYNQPSISLNYIKNLKFR